MSDPYAGQTITLRGPDALAFAHAQFSSDVRALAPGAWQFSAWLDPRGRVRALFHLARLDEQDLLMLLRGGQARQIATALAPYVMRSKLQIAATDPVPLATGEALALHVATVEQDTLRLGAGSHSLVLGGAGDQHWRLAHIQAGWPWLPEPLLGELLPASLALGALGATALDKGCYPGQEIVARLHYRGGNKRQLHRVHLSRPVPSGSVLEHAAGDPIQLLDVVAAEDGALALAVVHDESAPYIERGLHATHDSDGVIVRDWLNDRH